MPWGFFFYAAYTKSAGRQARALLSKKECLLTAGDRNACVAVIRVQDRTARYAIDNADLMRSRIGIRRSHRERSAHHGANRSGSDAAGRHDVTGHGRHDAADLTGTGDRNACVAGIRVQDRTAGHTVDDANLMRSRLREERAGG